MKPTTFVAALALSLAGSAAFAQMPAQNDPAQQNTIQSQAKARNPHKAAMRISRQLNLSPDQTAKIEPILADRQQKVADLRSNTTLTDQQRKKQMHVISASARLQMANVLTPDQMKQLKSIRKKQMQGTAPMGA
jgi:periplasmic protein CpxP/Spy